MYEQYKTWTKVFQVLLLLKTLSAYIAFGLSSVGLIYYFLFAISHTFVLFYVKPGLLVKLVVHLFDGLSVSKEVHLISHTVSIFFSISITLRTFPLTFLISFLACVVKKSDLPGWLSLQK